MGLVHWVQLGMTEGIGPVLIRRIIDQAGSAEAATQLSRRELQRVEGIGSGRAETIARSLEQAGRDAEAEIARAAEQGVVLVTPEDESYPALLKEIHDPPVVLYVRGALEPRDLQSVAIVGSRRCSHYGREQAERFAALLAGAGVTVISGGARGIDSAAHRGALQPTMGRTIAVLGSGVDVPYPPENAKLFEQIASGRGAVVSEFPLGTPPNAENFPRRNRIVAGMSRGTLVVEADERSGALITARMAIEDHGRPVFALPGRVDNKMSAGPHKLIREGAALVTCLEDIFAALEPLPDSVRQGTLFPGPVADAEPVGNGSASKFDGLGEQQRLILEHLGGAETNVDGLADATGLDVGVILRELTFLSLKGLVKRVDGQTFARARR